MHDMDSFKLLISTLVSDSLKDFSIIRKLLVVDDFPPCYQSDYNTKVIIISNEGTVEPLVANGIVAVPMFNIESSFISVEVKNHDNKSKIIQRIVQIICKQLAEKEDINGLAALGAAAQLENKSYYINSSGFLKQDLVNLKNQIDCWDLCTSKFLININELVDILKWGSNDKDFSPTVQRDL
jgi:hypothetical protein